MRTGRGKARVLRIDVIGTGQGWFARPRWHWYPLWKLTVGQTSGLTREEKKAGDRDTPRAGRISRETAIRMALSLNEFNRLSDTKRKRMIKKAVQSFGPRYYLEQPDVDEWVEFLVQSGGFEVW